MNESHKAGLKTRFGGLYHRRLRIELLEERRLLSLTGDYNANAVVDAGDYVVWRKSVGLTGTQPADGNGDHLVNDLDYGVWREHFGEELSAPGAFNITTPLGQDTDGNFTVQWQASANADTYKIELSDFSVGNTPFFSETLSATTRFFQGYSERTLYISVTAINAAGSTTASNNFRQLVIAFPDTRQVIFVTSSNFFIDFDPSIPPFGGFFGSANAADYHANTLANLNGLLSDPWDGTTYIYKALLTEGSVDLFIRANLGNNEYVNTKGDLVASNRAQLYSGLFTAPILTQNGNAVTGTNVPVWTGSNPDGTWSGFTAFNWSQPFGSLATVGNAVGTGSAWLSNGVRASNLGARLYAVGPAPHDHVPPTLVAPVPDQSIAVGSPLNTNLASAFHTADKFEQLKFEAYVLPGAYLPSWLTFNPATGLMSGTPTISDVGTFSINVTGVERYSGQSVSDQFQLTVTATGAGSIASGSAEPDSAGDVGNALVRNWYIGMGSQERTRSSPSAAPVFGLRANTLASLDRHDDALVAVLSSQWNTLKPSEDSGINNAPAGEDIFATDELWMDPVDQVFAQLACN